MRLLQPDRHVAAFAAVLIAIGFCQAAPGQMTITEVGLLEDQLELVNTGATTIDMSTWWWCNRVNGSPFYSAVNASTIEASLSTTTSLASVAPGDIVVFNLSSTILRDPNGELGLYNTNSFGSASAIEDYVLWGANGIRDLTAQTAGIWIDNDSIDHTSLVLGETIQLIAGLPGHQAAHYAIGPSSLGVDNSIPEPATLGLLLAGLAFAGRRC